MQLRGSTKTCALNSEECCSGPTALPALCRFRKQTNARRALPPEMAIAGCQYMVGWGRRMHGDSVHPFHAASRPCQPQQHQASRQNTKCPVGKTRCICNATGRRGTSSEITSGCFLRFLQSSTAQRKNSQDTETKIEQRIVAKIPVGVNGKGEFCRVFCGESRLFSFSLQE